MRQKLGFLNFSAAAGMDPAELLLAYLAAACDPNDQVSRRGDELLKKRCGIDAYRPPGAWAGRAAAAARLAIWRRWPAATVPRLACLTWPAVNLEDARVVEPLFELFHGTADDDSLPEQVSSVICDPGTHVCRAAAACRHAPVSPWPLLQQRRAPAGVALRTRLLSIFCKSVAAANCFPHSLTVGHRSAGQRLHASRPPQCTRRSLGNAIIGRLARLQTITVCLYGQQTTPRQRQAGMEFAVWVFKHAAPQQLAPAAASILDSLLQLLEDGKSSHAPWIRALLPVAWPTA